VLWRPAGVIERHADLLPTRGRALDVACGSGRHAVWLAARGLATWGFDRLPDALARAAPWRKARSSSPRVAAPPARAARLRARGRDPRPAVPARSFDVVCGIRYLDRGLFARVADLLVPGGFSCGNVFIAADAAARPRRPHFASRRASSRRAARRPASWSSAPTRMDRSIRSWRGVGCGQRAFSLG